MKTWEKLLIAGVLIYLVLAAVGGSFNPNDWGFMQAVPTRPSTGAAVAGMFDVDTKGYNSLDISTTYAEATAYDCYWYAMRGGWILLGKGQATVEITEYDGGVVYAVVKARSGQNLYVDSAETKAKNQRVISVAYDDVDRDGYKDYVFTVSMANIPKPATGNPKIFFYPYFLAYEKPSINSHSAITGIGTARTTRYVEWFLSFSNVKRAFAITKIEVTMNTTDASKVEIKSIAVPGVGTVTGDMLGAPLRGVNTLTYSYNIGSNLYNALYLKYPVNTLNKFHLTNELSLSLSSGDVIAYTITVTGLTDTGSITTITNTVTLAA